MPENSCLSSMILTVLISAALLHLGVCDQQTKQILKPPHRKTCHLKYKINVQQQPVKTYVENCTCLLKDGNIGNFRDDTLCYTLALGYDQEYTQRIGKCKNGICVPATLPYGCQGIKPSKQANLRYRSMVQPRVQLTIVGISVTTKRSDESYMVEISGYQATKNINYGQTIENFKTFVAQKSYFATSDIIFLLTGKNMSYWENKQLKHSIGGFAYLAGACTEWRVGMTEERVGSYYGVFVFAHELAHSLGCVHDGAAASSWPNGHIGSADCPYDNGYMMSYKFTKPYMYKFSPCCQREVMNIYNRPAYECLSIKNAIKPGLHSSKFPGEVSSRETYCKKVYSSYSYVSADKKYNMSRCIVKCYISRKGDNMLIGAVDGVSCGRKKMCVLGNCTSRPPIDKAE